MLSFTAVQIFNRRSIGFLWDKRSELDPGQVSIINSIYNNKKKGSVIAEQTITYKLSNKTAGKLGFGRLYGTKGSFETLEKECRGTICKDYYHDIDIVNCHPVLLLQFARKKYNVDLPEVDKYVSNRETYLKNVMTENAVNREDAKSAIISVLYGGSVNQASYLHELSQEVRGFSKKLFTMDEYAELGRACKSEKNIYGSFLAFILQTEERHCMLAMKENLESQGFSVDVLCYDGVMIRKRDKDGVVPDILACEQAVEAKTGYKISLVTKEFSSFELPSLSEEVCKGVTLDAYNEMKRDFEKNHFYHQPSDKFVEVHENSTMTFMTLPHAHEYLNSTWSFKQSEKLGDYIPFLDIWRKDIKRKICMETSFKESDDPNIFTLPIHFAYMKDKPFTHSPRALELFKELIDINCSGDSVLKEYMLHYFAHMLQKTTDLPGVALVITGSKGTGKDTLGDFLQQWVVGNHLSTNYTTNTQFFGTHDTGKLNKVLIKLEETSRKDCFEHSSELKATITARQITVNPKGVKEITSDNFARYIFTTNKPNPVDISDNERRFVLLCCSDKRKGDYNFWTEVRQVLFTYNGGRTVAEYLLSVDISQFQVRALPKNNYQESVIISEKSSEDIFIEQWEGLNTSVSNLYKEYSQYCISNNLRYAQDSKWFGKNLQKYVRNGAIINTHPQNISYYKKP
jgi:adenylate kinase family enzyme